MLTDNWQNDTLSTIAFNKTTMMTNIVTSVARKRHVTLASQIVLTLVYITGVVGNVSALVILFHRDKVIHKIRLFISSLINILINIFFHNLVMIIINKTNVNQKLCIT